MDVVFAIRVFFFPNCVAGFVWVDLVVVVCFWCELFVVGFFIIYSVVFVFCVM